MPAGSNKQFFDLFNENKTINNAIQVAFLKRVMVKSLKQMLGEEEEEKLDKTGKYPISNLNSDFMNNKEMSEDFRILMPIYYEDNGILIVGHPETGIWRYMNATRLDAIGQLRTLWRAANNPVKNPLNDYFINNKFLYRLIEAFAGEEQKPFELFKEMLANQKNLENQSNTDYIHTPGDGKWYVDGVVDYMKHLTKFKLLLSKAETDYNTMKKDKWEYYKAKAPAEVYAEKPFDLKILRTDIDKYLESDTELQRSKQKVDYLETTVDFLDRTIRQIANRGFTIKNAIDWRKFTSGAI